MRLRRALLATLLSVVSFAYVQNTYSDADSNADATAVIKALNLGGNLKNMVANAVFRTQTYQIVTSQVGATKAGEILQREMEVVLPKYQDEWNMNQAKSYLEYFSVAEIQSVAKDRQASPYASKFALKQSDVGLSMQKKSSDLLVKIVSKVSVNVYKNLSREK